MRLPSINAAVLLLALCTTAEVATADVSYFQDQAKVIRAPNAVSALGADLFGDKVNLYSGALEFIQTDVEIPGNNALPVMIGRGSSTGGEVLANKQFGTWDLEIPHLHGTYTASKGWVIPFPTADRPAGSRCSNLQPPPEVPGAGAGQPSNFTPDEYWHGHQMYIPGQGDQLLLRRGANYTDGPKDGQTYPVVTQGQWSLRCVASLANDTSAGKTMGEGFFMDINSRVIFRLTKDGSGYPPTDTESLWAKPLGNGKFKIDNIPFYVMGISSDDEVEVNEVNGDLFFRNLRQASGNSTFRLLLSDPKASTAVREHLAKLGCSSEYNQFVGVVAVEIPASVPIQRFLDYIVDGQQRGIFDIEEGALRHHLS